MAEEIHYHEVIYDSVRDQFLIADMEHGDYVSQREFQRRRIWNHTCPKGGKFQYTKRVKKCNYCGQERPNDKR